MKKKEEHRGGARKGAGRKRKNIEKAVTVSFCCSPEQKEQLDTECENLGIKRSDYICNKLF